MKNMIRWTVALLTTLLFATCLRPETVQSPDNRNTDNPAPGNSEITIEEILTAYGLERGKITASEAAKKINESAPRIPSPAFNFTEKTLVSYDDKTGVFKMKLKGIKNGKEFEKEILADGFPHPLAGKQPQSVIKNDLKFDVGIEENLSVEKYIEKVTASGTRVPFFKEGMSFMLSDSTTKIELGDHGMYSLTAVFEKSGSDKIKIKPVYKVRYRRRTEGETAETEFPPDEPIFTQELRNGLIKDYFTENDVFQYILNKTNDNFVKVNPNEFASEFYAIAKGAGITPDGLLDMNQIKKYQEIYKEKNADKHLMLKIDAGIYQPQNGGVKADDHTGTLTVNYCITTTDRLASQSGIFNSKEVTKSGFLKIENEADLKKYILFTVIMPNPSANKTKWLNKRIAPNFRLFAINESGNKEVNKPFSISDPFYLSVNSDNPSDPIGLGNASYNLTKVYSGAQLILIRAVRLNKNAGNKKLQISVELQGGHTIETETVPFLGHTL